MAKHLMVDTAPAASAPEVLVHEIPTDCTARTREKSKGGGGRRSPALRIQAEERTTDDATASTAGSTHNEPFPSSFFATSPSSATSSPSASSANKSYFRSSNNNNIFLNHTDQQVSYSSKLRVGLNAPSSFDPKLFLRSGGRRGDPPETPETVMGSFSNGSSPPSFHYDNNNIDCADTPSSTSATSTPTAPPGLSMMMMLPHDDDEDDVAKLSPFTLPGHRQHYFLDDLPSSSTDHLLRTSQQFAALTNKASFGTDGGDNDTDQFILSKLPPGILQGLGDLAEDPQSQQTQPPPTTTPLNGGAETTATTPAAAVKIDTNHNNKYDDHYHNTVPPLLTLPPPQQAQFDALSTTEQKLTRNHCYDAARTTKMTIRNPQSFYAKVFDRYRRQGALPSFILPKSQQLELESLPPSLQEEAKQFCLDAARSLSNTGGAIRNPSSYFGRVFKTFLEQRQKQQQAAGIVTTTVSTTSTFSLDEEDASLDPSTIKAVITEQQLQQQSDTTASRYTDAPEFILSKDRQKKFDSLTPSDQCSVRQACAKAAHTLVQSGHTVRHPAAYYTRVFDSLFQSDGVTLNASVIDDLVIGSSSSSASTPDHINTHSNASTTTSNNTDVEAVPAFILPPSPRRQFQALPAHQQEAAKEFCFEMARSVLAVKATIRSPAAFYGSAFHRFRQSLRRGGSGGGSSTAGGSVCASTTTAAAATTSTPTISYAAAAASGVANPSTSTAVSTTTTTAPQQSLALPPFALTNNQRRNFDNLSSVQQKIARQYCHDAAVASVQKSGKPIRDPTRFYSWALHCYFEENNLIKIDALASSSATADKSGNNKSTPATSSSPPETNTNSPEELLCKIESLTKEVNTLRNQRSKIDARRSSAEESVRKYEQTNATLTEQLAAIERKYNELYQEKKHVEEKYKSEGETYHKMTAAFTSISEELIGERKARREVEDRLREEQDKCRKREAEIQDLQAELGRISLFS